MGWSVGFDERWKRDIGYGVPADCDHADRGERIDHGLSYVCGGESYGDGQSLCDLANREESTRRSVGAPEAMAQSVRIQSLPDTSTRAVSAHSSWVSYMDLRLQTQVNPVADEVSALIAVIRPILEGLLYGLKNDVVSEVGGYEQVKLKMLPRLYRRGDGDIGLCFEYAVHQAVRAGTASVCERVADALALCKIAGSTLSSLLFAVEKTGKLDLVDSVRDSLTDQSQLLYGTRGRPVKLKRHIDQVAQAFHRPTARLALPQSISGLWKADLFLGTEEMDNWVGTSIKVNVTDLRAERGLRVGIVPTRQGRKDRVVFDDTKNLVLCPLPYDGSFMELFYSGWRIVQQFIAADARVPKEDSLPFPHERQVARELEMRRDTPLLRVVEILEVQSQPGLIESRETRPPLVSKLEGKGELVIDSVLAPIPRSED